MGRGREVCNGKPPRRTELSPKTGRKVVAQAGGRRRRRWPQAVKVAVVLILLAVSVVAVRKATKHPAAEQFRAALNNPAMTAAIGQSNAPPWPAPGDATAGAARAGLPMLQAEGTVEHIHAHLDVIADGSPVTVPAGIGVDGRRGTISPLHTHDSSGVIHIESPMQRQFSLGQFFTEWGVSLSDNNIGALHATGVKSVRAYVNGLARGDNPAAIILGNHDEITLIYGVRDPRQSPLSSYHFDIDG